MQKMKFIIGGVLAGIAYGFISFFLISTSLRTNPAGLIFWGIEGFLFAVFFLLASSLFPKNNSMIGNAIKGLTSGVLAFSFFGEFTYYNAVIRPERVGTIVISSVKNDVLVSVSYYLFGFALLGLIAGVIIYKTKSDS